MICNRLIRRGRMDVFGGIFVALAAKGGNLDQRTIDAHLQAVMIKSITLQLVPELPLDRDL